MAHRSHYAVPAPAPAPVTHAPQHPVPQLQGPFEESMFESGRDETEVEFYQDPVARRNALLDAPVYERIIAGRWRKKPDECFHPLWKLIAQISFGIHLLAEGMARSEDEVMQILQAHVDEIDGFLERTTEDFDLAQDDISERLRCLKLPLSHPATFDKMLEDRNFRMSIVEGNEKIEHIVDRTSRAMKDSLKDVQKGFESTSSLELYLHDLSAKWHRESMEHEAVFVAMLGNVEGWRKAFMGLHMQGNKLGGSLKKLTDIINEMQARAGEVSRRLLHQARVQHPQSMGRPADKPHPVSRYKATGVAQKQLPGMPNGPDRPSLRQTASSNTIRTASRTASSDALRDQALYSRSQTPQHDMPATQRLRSEASPHVVSVGANSQARVQSMVPSLLNAAPSPKPSQLTRPEPVIEDEQNDRYFPPVELPAHVPEETMRAAPMSKQNRLSSGLGLIQANRAERRTSKLPGTTALLELLRPAHRKQSVSTTKTKSPEASRRASTVHSGAGNDNSTVSSRAKAAAQSPPRSISTDATSQHTKNNVKRPKKGAQHWFEALEDEYSDLDIPNSAEVSATATTATTASTIPTPMSAPPMQTVETSLTVPAKHQTDTTPGTPSWATKGFAQVEKHKELLKMGAFNSHPPGVPLGSPPMLQNAPPTLAPPTHTIPRRPVSRNSSVALSTLGEPGPEVTASDAGSVAPSILRADLGRRQSAFAPEVVVINRSPLPTAGKSFVIAEMEGSIPASMPPSQASRTFATELEAPQQYFNLPPRPKPEAPVIHEAPDAQVHVPHFQLPPRPAPVTEETASSRSSAAIATGSVPSELTELVMAQSENVANAQSEAPGETVTAQTTATAGATALEEVSKPNAEVSELKDVIKDHKELQSQPRTPQPPAVITTAASPNPEASQSFALTSPQSTENDNIVEHLVESTPSAELLSSKVYVATPTIPLPLSPVGPDSARSPSPVNPPPSSSSQEQLYLLPAIAYKAPSPPPGLPESSRWSGASKTSQTPERPTPPVSVDPADRPNISKRLSVPLQTENEGDHVQSVPATASALIKTAMDDEYDPYKALDNEPSGPKNSSPTANTKVAIVRTEIEHKPVSMGETINSPVSDAQNDWKAFFTGKASPAGSNLSIRSMKRDSILEQPQLRPRALSPRVNTRDKMLPPRPPSDSSKEGTVSSPLQKPPTQLVQGLGITMEASEERY